MQRDILVVSRNLASVADILWKTSIDVNHEDAMLKNVEDSNNSIMIQKHLTTVGLHLLQLSGALGMDFVTLLKHAVEKEELTVF